MVLYIELLLLDMLSALPTDVLGIVHAFLSTGARCVIHDPGAAFRCCSKLFSWDPPHNACCSLHQIVYSKLELCDRTHRHVWVGGVQVRVPDETFRPHRLCLLHDCADEWDAESFLEQLEALRQLVEQINVAQRPLGLTLSFSSWKAVSRFILVMKRAGLNLCSWTPYMTRCGTGGIQVTWLRKSMCSSRGST